MINPEIISKVRASTCGVLRLDQTHEQLFADKQDQEPFRPESTTFGTAFLVTPNLALTNRHVVQLVLQDAKKLGHFENWYLEFVYLKEGGGVHEAFARVLKAMAIEDPTGGNRFDVGFLEFERWGEPWFEECVPVDLGNLASIEVGIDVGLCGFPLGNELLVANPTIWRFGPVIHQGIISGIAPFENANPRNITSFITDMNTASGMSGSPVFTLSDGRVIGLHFAGAPGTLGCAIPIDRHRMDSWVNYYDMVMSTPGQDHKMKFRGGGDIVFD